MVKIRLVSKGCSYTTFHVLFLERATGGPDKGPLPVGRGGGTRIRPINKSGPCRVLFLKIKKTSDMPFEQKFGCKNGGLYVRYIPNIHHIRGAPPPPPETNDYSRRFVKFAFIDNAYETHQQYKISIHSRYCSFSRMISVSV